MKKLVVRDSLAGNIIEEVATLEEGKNLIKKFEEEDKEEDNYTPDFYEVAEVEI